MNTRVKLERLYADATCRDSDPKYFDSTDHESSSVALRMCQRCEVRDLCTDVIQPTRHYYDGVVGGRVYSNGNDVTLKVRIKDFAKLPVDPIDVEAPARDELLIEQDELLAKCSGCGAWTFGSSTCDLCK